MLDISKSPMEVAPTAHYTMGGVVVDSLEHSTNVKGLYAAGECTSGVHGANRLGGNSLAEILVFGKIAGLQASKFSENLNFQRRNKDIILKANQELDELTSTGEELARPLQRAVRDVMWEFCGVLRSEKGLKKGLSEILKIKKASKNIDVRPSAEGFIDLALAIDLLGSIDSAISTILSAIERKESRGAHQRKDYDKIDENLRVNYLVEMKNGEQKLSSQKVKDLPVELVKPMKDFKDINVDGRLLE